MKRYETYKDSGVEWLGEVPGHWEKVRFKHFLSLITEPSESNVKIGLENIESQTGRYIPSNSEFEGNGVAFKESDIVYGKLRPYLQKVWKAEFEGNAVGDFFVFRAKEDCDAEYTKYVMLSSAFTEVADGSTCGAKMPRVSSQFILNLEYYLPTKEEQHAIAAYLDAKTQQLDAIISEKEAQVEDLQKYRQSVISETVTRGLNPDVEMKESGVEWIGEVPAHWETAKLKHCLKAQLKYGASESGEFSQENWPRYIRITDIGPDGKLRNDSCKYLNPEIADEYLLEKGDVLFARSGATVGKTYIFNEDYQACFAGYLIKASCDRHSLLPEYLYYYTNSIPYENWKNSIFCQATIQNIGADKYNEMPIALPSMDEQQAIADYLDGKISQIDHLVNEIHAQLADLRSYKSSLITEAVTGKVDVRDWAEAN